MTLDQTPRITCPQCHAEITNWQSKRLVRGGEELPHALERITLDWTYEEGDLFGSCQECRICFEAEIVYGYAYVAAAQRF